MINRVLDYLKRRAGYISGEEISQHLGISRQALWKHIHELKNLGYDIVAIPHLGYQLKALPDRLFPSEVTHRLHTKFIGRKVNYFDTLASTMDVAMDLGLKGACEGTLIVAESQTRGRGRLGRVWSSPKYKGIYLSLILRPQISPNAAPILTLLTGVSACEAIKEVTGQEVKIKWPNDLLIHGRKIGGILTELNAQTDLAYFVIIGLGLNVNNTQGALIPGATSLREQEGENINRLELLQEILRRIESEYLLFQEQGSEAVIDKWRSYNITLGKRVKVSSLTRSIEGEAVDIDKDGGLLLRNDSGLTEKVMAGDVTHCR